MSIEGQGHFFTIYCPDFVCYVLYQAKISGERLQDHSSSGFIRSLLELVTRKPVFWVATGSDINRAVQPPGTATEDGLKLEISNNSA